MGLLIQDEYPYWGCHMKPFVDQSLNKGRPPSPYCDCNPDTLFPELLAWVRERDVKECKVQWYHIWKPPTKWHLEPALPARTR